MVSRWLLIGTGKTKTSRINILVSIGYGFSVSLLYFFILFTYLDKLMYIQVFLFLFYILPGNKNA